MSTIDVSGLPFAPYVDPINVRSGPFESLRVKRIYEALTPDQQTRVLAIRDAFATAIQGKKDATCVWIEEDNGRLVLAHEAAVPVLTNFGGPEVRWRDAVIRNELAFYKDLPRQQRS